MQPSSGKRTRRVLVVEDDTASCNALCGILRVYGVEPVAVSTIAAAMNELQLPGIDPFEAIILDLMLPDGDGSRVLSFARETGLAAKICVVTAANDGRLIERVRALKPDCLLRKPFDVAELLGKLALTQ